LAGIQSRGGQHRGTREYEKKGLDNTCAKHLSRSVDELAVVPVRKLDSNPSRVQGY
jgi:hypothetical protein